MIAQLTVLWKHHVTRGIASYMLGFLLWFMLRMQYDCTRHVIIPLHIQTAQSLHVIAPEVAVVEITGPWNSLLHFLKNNPLITLNGHLLKKGLQEITITREQLHLPPELHITNKPVIPVFVNPPT